ncbi:OsmC family protein [Solibacillus sp. FSL H8-0538]|uniref:OsmC family protein n=1 Tax=Solibacillus sp. FSL H8-0538 TaxID=2921400 RepID=UPI0030F8D0F8
MGQHKFFTNINWPGGRNDVGSLDAMKLKTEISIPEEMDGPGIGTNPDEMLLGAAATCYIISLAAMLERSGIEAKLKLQSEGIVDVTNGVFTYEQILHHVTISLQERSERNEKMAHRLGEKAEQTCMISKALRGNVEIKLTITLN